MTYDVATIDSRHFAGIRSNALLLNGSNEYAQVVGQGHRLECFGDLSKCTKGQCTLHVLVNAKVKVTRSESPEA